MDERGPWEIGIGGRTLALRLAYRLDHRGLALRVAEGQGGPRRAKTGQDGPRRAKVARCGCAGCATERGTRKSNKYDVPDRIGSQKVQYCPKGPELLGGPRRSEQGWPRAGQGQAALPLPPTSRTASRNIPPSIQRAAGQPRARAMVWAPGSGQRTPCPRGPARPFNIPPSPWRPPRPPPAPSSPRE